MGGPRESEKSKCKVQSKRLSLPKNGTFQLTLHLKLCAFQLVQRLVRAQR
jgi:hypothetical protein